LKVIELCAEYADAAVKILDQARVRETRLTGLKLVEALMGRGTSNLKLQGWQVPARNRYILPTREPIFSAVLVE
jgi:hypothetical protein